MAVWHCGIKGWPSSCAVPHQQLCISIQGTKHNNAWHTLRAGFNMQTNARRLHTDFIFIIFYMLLTLQRQLWLPLFLFVGHLFVRRKSRKLWKLDWKEDRLGLNFETTPSRSHIRSLFRFSLQGDTNHKGGWVEVPHSRRNNRPGLSHYHVRGISGLCDITKGWSLSNTS